MTLEGDIFIQSPTAAIPVLQPSSVDDVFVFSSELGPWQTKSGGNMNVTAIFDESVLRKMLDVDPHELLLAPDVKLGLRSFTTTGLTPGVVGGKHFHRLKREVISISHGKVEFFLEDVYGNSRIIALDKNTRAICIPTFIMHTYTVIEACEITGISNTLYDHDNPKTHDTYDDETFMILKKHFLKH